MNRYLAGAIGGLLATVPMTLAMESLYRRLPRDERDPLPPRKITQNLLHKTDKEHGLDEDRRVELSLLSHFAYGAVTGALYPLTTRRVTHPLVFGGGYGLAVWAASYLGWVPAFKLLAPATRQPAERRRLMLCAHLVWGGGTVLLGERLAQRRDEAWREPDERSHVDWQRP